MAKLYAIFTKVSFGLGVCGLLWAGIFEDVPIKLILIGLIILFVLFFQGLAITDLSDTIVALERYQAGEIARIDNKIGTEEDSVSESNNTWVCIKCGQTNPSSVRFCRNCGK